MNELNGNVGWKDFRKVIKEVGGVLDLSKLVMKAKERFFGVPISCIPATLNRELQAVLPNIPDPNLVIVDVQGVLFNAIYKRFRGFKY